MHGVQEKELRFYCQQEKTAEKTGEDEVLQVVQNAHLAQGIEVV
jgi:hypothetical protein